MAQASSSESTRIGRWRQLLLAAVAIVGFTAPSGAIVFYARDEALKLAFPDADHVEARDFFLTQAQHDAIETKSRSKVESDLLTVYVGHRGDGVAGYAVLDSHVVRTLPETFMIVMSPDGQITATHVLAFYEPTEYMPSDRWLEQFEGKGDEADLRVGRGIAAITGSTLTSHAVAAAVRRALTIYEVLLEPN